MTKNQLKNKRIQIPKKGLDYYVPVWGYLRYTLPLALKLKQGKKVAENTLLYGIIGVAFAFANSNVAILCLIVLGLLIVIEAEIYYYGWARIIFHYRKKFPKGVKALRIFLPTQMHALGFMLLGFILVRLIMFMV